MTKLSVNVNKIALLRNTRDLERPNVVYFSRLALDAGASGITVHPRPDERHIVNRDVLEISDLIRQRPGVEFNIEGNPFHQLMECVRAVKPTQATLVPDEVDAKTSDHGWDLARDGERLKTIIEELHDLGVRVSLFMDPHTENIYRAKDIGSDRIELYTEGYARAFHSDHLESVVAQYRDAAETAVASGLGVNAGHDLNLENLSYFLAEVPNVKEVSIGHALTADALEYGMTSTVQKYLAQIKGAKE
jgi:pyridoxine 5-phosphate synthase